MFCSTAIMQTCTGASLADLANVNIVENIKEHSLRVILNSALHGCYFFPEEHKKKPRIFKETVACLVTSLAALFCGCVYISYFNLDLILTRKRVRCMINWFCTFSLNSWVFLSFKVSQCSKKSRPCSLVHVYEFPAAVVLSKWNVLHHLNIFHMV